MTRRAAPEEIVCAGDIAERLGVVPSAVTNWRNRSSVKFPAPWATPRSGALWLWEDVETWAADRAAKREATRQATIVRLRRQLERLEAR